MSHLPASYGRFSKVHVISFLPDPGASNSRTHTISEKKRWVYFGLTRKYMYFDM